MWHGLRLSVLVTVTVVDDDNDGDKGVFEEGSGIVELASGSAATKVCDKDSVCGLVILVDGKAVLPAVSDVARQGSVCSTSWLCSSPCPSRDGMVIATSVLAIVSRVCVVVFKDARRRRDLGDGGLSVDRNGFIWIFVVLAAAAAAAVESEAVVVIKSSDDTFGLVREIFLTEAISSPFAALILH